jgi:hypothetical protein
MQYYKKFATFAINFPTESLIDKIIYHFKRKTENDEKIPYADDLRHHGRLDVGTECESDEPLAHRGTQPQRCAQ